MDGAGKDKHQEQLRQQTALAKFGELVLRSEDLDEILTEACHLIGEGLGTDLAKVMELQKDGRTLLVRAGVGWKPGVVGVATVQAADDTSEGHALKTGKPMISADIARETRFRYPPFLIENGVKAVANVLILGSQGKPPFGILQIDSREPRAFTDDDTTFLRGYANLLAAAVDRLRGIAELRASSDRQQAALATGLISFFEWNVPAGTITTDRHFAGFSGLDPEAAAAGVPLDALLALIHPDDQAMVKAGIGAALTSLADYTMEFRLVHAGGEVRWVLVRGHCYEQEGGDPLRYTGTAVDVTASKAAEAVLRQANEALEASVAERTRELVEANARLRDEAEERERVEEALRQSHKMEAIGQLTGGVAHDFNNLLAGILGSLEMIRTRTGQGRTAEIGRYIEAALSAVNRAAALTHRLLAFARRQTLDPRPTDVNRLVTGMEDLIRRTVGPGIRVETRLAPGLWPTLCDPNQLESALLNLVINARDAMPEGGGLVIETLNATLPERRRASHAAGMPVGDHVGLVVSDIGAGMAPEVLARAFDPFFTTKPLGQGTGLGLSMIYGFVRQSGGQVQLRSEPGQGTTVTIHLPRHRGTADGEAGAEITPAPPRAEGGAVVLVVDDEPGVRLVVHDALADQGYTVLEAEDGRTALCIVESEARLDLLISDVGLPGGMNGRQLVDAARGHRPGLKVLLITGYAEGAALGGDLPARGVQVMTKPFAMDAFVARVQGIISD